MMDIPPPVLSPSIAPPADDFWLKIFVVVLAAILGWAAGQGGKVFDEWRKNRKLKKDLLDELRNIRDTAAIALTGFARGIQGSAHGMVENDVQFKINTPIFNNFYKDVCSKLNRRQRQSFEMTYGYVDSINLLIGEQLEAVFEHNKHRTKETTLTAVLLVEAQFHNVCVLIWHIDHHLANPQGPELGLGTAAHREYLRELVKIDDKIGELIEKAKKIDPRDFAKRYDPRHFKHLDTSTEAIE